jgi:hypothetical protein
MLQVEGFNLSFAAERKVARQWQCISAGQRCKLHKESLMLLVAKERLGSQGEENCMITTESNHAVLLTLWNHHNLHVQRFTIQ